MKTRREFLRTGFSTGLLLLVPTSGWIAWAELEPTPSSTAGPFYKQGAPFRHDFREANDHGISLRVSGQIQDAAGRGLTNAVVDIWHTNPDGDYDMAGYRYRGRVKTDTKGSYQFETFMPGAYGGRAQHIHYTIEAPGKRSLTTQLYFANDPYFEGSPEKNFRRDPIISSPKLIKPVTKSANDVHVVFTIVLRNA